MKNKTDHTPVDLKVTFDSAASLYEEMRPSYPEALINDVAALSQIPNNGHILEVGCGTGKATKLFASRKYHMVCLDIGPELLAVAKEQLKPFPNVSFVLSAFEDYHPNRAFDLVVSATAFHWINPNVRFIKVRDALISHGSLATFNNHHIRKNEGFFSEVQSIYNQYYIRPNRPNLVLADASSHTPGIDAFKEPIQRTYPWSQTYTTEQYIKLLCTYSDHIAQSKN
ncbi:MAG: class I SAM-dependent methyltransferase, partial [Candidatus Latescibacterota bacterium]